jgi:glyoxylase-like metal-dependent hydrolase (beta-lactamase superfamily II)
LIISNKLLVHFCRIALFISAIFFGYTQAQTSISGNDPAGVLVEPVKVAANTYFVQGLPEMGSSKNQNFISNAGFVITPEGVVVIDALGSPVLAQKLIKEVKKVTNKKIVAVIVTHYHADHVYGLQEFKKIGAKIYAQREGRDYLASETAKQRLIASRVDFAPWVNQSTHLQPADVWFDREYKLTIGGVKFLIGRAGPAHSPEDLLIYVPSEKALFVGDLVFRGRIPYVGNADSKGWLHALDLFEEFQPRVVIPGHGAVSVSPGVDIRFTRDYLIYLRETMAKAAVNMDPFDEAYQQADWSEYEGMPLFGAANRMNAYNVYLSIQAE